MEDAEPRLPAHLEAASLIRRVQAEGGFAAILQKGDRDSGALLVIFVKNGANAIAYERMPHADGSRKWTRGKVQDAENPDEFDSYINRRRTQDRDVWIIELDIVNGERFIGLTPDAA